MSDEFNYLKEELIERIPGRLHFSYDILNGDLIVSVAHLTIIDLDD